METASYSWVMGRITLVLTVVFFGYAALPASAAPGCYPSAVPRAADADAPFDMLYFAARHFSTPSCKAYRPVQAAEHYYTLVSKTGWDFGTAAYLELVAREPALQERPGAPTIDDLLRVLGLVTAPSDSAAAGAERLDQLLRPAPLSPGRLATAYDMLERPSDERIEALLAEVGDAPIYSAAILIQCFADGAKTLLSESVQLACIHHAYAHDGDGRPDSIHSDWTPQANRALRFLALDGYRPALALGARRHLQRPGDLAAWDAFRWLRIAEFGGAQFPEIRQAIEDRLGRDTIMILDALERPDDFLPAFPPW